MSEFLGGEKLEFAEVYQSKQWLKNCDFYKLEALFSFTHPYAPDEFSEKCQFQYFTQ